MLESRAMIEAIKIEFHTKPATDALSKLAQAALKRPEIVKAIADLPDPLFDCAAENHFHDDPSKTMTISVFPSSALRAFMRAIEVADGRRPAP